MANGAGLEWGLILTCPLTLFPEDGTLWQLRTVEEINRIDFITRVF